ncbi:hypothetical protein GIB67_026066 [Kingdonia uniflora]|uniref:Uncharacterized protein n=1 Tax=Kingdonia uniflora TaxID=39325 RepID=A0A7J7M303_9MAGN|nr:hypothetical protein GIB67_026066 [Kingdonia uniflora]
MEKSTTVLSDRPECVLGKILTCLPIEEAVRTSILASQWRYKWTTLSELVFKYQTINHDKLVNIVDRVLLLHKGDIQMFVLSSFCLKSTPVIDSWLLYLSWNGIKEITLEFKKGEVYKMPSCLFSCQNLSHLKLHGCIIKLPSSSKGFRNLKILCLELKVQGRLKEFLVENATSLDFMDIKLFSSVSKEEHLKKTDHYNLVKVLGSLPAIKELQLWLFIAAEDMDDFFAVLCLLRSSPSIKDLVIFTWSCGNVAVTPVEDDLELPDHLDGSFYQLQTDSWERIGYTHDLYVGGKQHKFDNVDGDRLSLICLIEYVFNALSTLNKDTPPELIDDDTSEDDTFGDDTSTGENSGDSDSVYNEWVVHGYIGEQSDVEFEETQLRLVRPSLEVNEPNVGGRGLIHMLGGSETNNSGPSELPLSELFKLVKKLKKTKTNGPSEAPLENKSMKTRVEAEPQTERARVEPQTTRARVEPQNKRARVEPQTNIGSRKKAQTKKQANKPTQKEKELKEKKNKNKVGEPTKPTNKRAKPSDLPEEELDVLPVVYDSDGKIVIIEEVEKLRMGHRLGVGIKLKTLGKLRMGHRLGVGIRLKTLGLITQMKLRNGLDGQNYI